MRSEWVDKRREPCVTQMYYARRGELTEEMRPVAERGHQAPELIRGEVARGRMIIPANIRHTRLEPMGIGVAARTDLNAHIGSSAVSSGIDEELAKLTAHAANVAPYRPGAGDRDDATSRARCAFDWNPQLPLAMAPETARAMHDETLPQEGDKSAEFCRMCGPKPCAMHIDAEMHRLTRQLTDAGTLALAALGPHEDAPTHVTPTSAFKIPQT